MRVPPPYLDLSFVLIMEGGGRDISNETLARKGHVRAQREDSHQQAQERGLGRNQTCQNLDLGHPEL